MAEGQLNIKQLEAFRAVVLVGTVNGAANLLDVSQPSISRLVGQLESSLRVVLFDRSNGRLVLTAEGQMIYDQVAHAFNAMEKIRESARDIQNARVGSLSIACMPALALGFLPKVIHAFCEQHPDVNISLHIQVSPKIEDLIVAQHIDFGLAQLPFVRDDMVVDEFCKVPYYAALQSGHELCSKGVLSPRDYEGLRFISLTTNNSVRHLVDQLFSIHEVNRVMNLETSYLNGVCQFVGSGLGVGLADPFTLDDFAHSCTPRIMAPSVEFHVGLVYPSHRPLSKIGRTFINFLKAKRDEVLKRIQASAGRQS